MSNIQIFNYQNQRVRTTEKDGETWFVASDVCAILELSNPSDALKRLESEERTLVSIEGASNGLPVNAVNESGIYELVLGSRKPEAKEFKRWIKTEVLPSIRKHGAYMTPETIEKTLSDPDFIIGLATQLKEERAARQIAEAQAETLQIENKSMQPKVDYFDDIVKHGHCTNFRETAGMLKIQQNEFIKWLLEKKFIYRDDAAKLQPYAAKNHGYFEVKDCIKGSFSGTQTVITPKGRAHFLSLLRIGRLEECK